MQVQRAINLPSQSFSRMVAIVATGVAASLALALVVTAERPTSTSTSTVVTLHGVGGEQVAHNRSEQGFGSSASVTGEQIAHNRSEEGLANP